MANSVRLWDKIMFTGEHSATIGEPVDEKQTVKQIYDACVNITTYLDSGNKRSTGFYVKLNDESNFFLTTAHSLEDKQQIIIGDVEQGLVVKKLNDFAVLEVFTNRLIPDISSLGLVSEGYSISIGERVYFFGYPTCVGHNGVFHQGFVSSINGDKFSIDGSILPGHSGSPVVVIEGDKFCLLGMVTSEAAASIDDLSYLRRQKDTSIQRVAHVIESNISSGIGWAIDIRSCKKMLINEEGNLDDIDFDIYSLYQEIEEIDREKELPVSGATKFITVVVNGAELEYSLKLVDYKKHTGPWKSLDKMIKQNKSERYIKRVMGKRRENIAIFFAKFAGEKGYKALAESIIEKWAKNENNEQNTSIVEWDEPVGWSNDSFTNRVQLVYDADVGSHIYPI